MLKNFIFKARKIIEYIFIRISLFILYCIGFGAMSFILRIFKPSIFINNRSCDDSYWKTADGYDESIQEATEQS
jgi:hypothetical protein